jgi:hypothetical protein
MSISIPAGSRSLPQFSRNGDLHPRKQFLVATLAIVDALRQLDAVLGLGAGTLDQECREHAPNYLAVLAYVALLHLVALTFSPYFSGGIRLGSAAGSGNYQSAGAAYTGTVDGTWNRNRLDGLFHLRHTNSPSVRVRTITSCV